MPAGAFAQSSAKKVKIDADAQKAIANITAPQMRDYLFFVASDEMEGRNTPSRGLDLTAKFIATLLSRWGVKPAGDNGTYFQKFAVRKRKPEDPDRTTQNVVAMIEGSDPKLKAEFVAVGAHYDHVGMNPNAPGEDKISNGADDDGSGTVAVLAIAEALAKSPQKPKRSILFVWHAGEEKGLLGSDYYTANPTVPIASIVTQLNIDMIGRSRPAGDTNEKNATLTAADEIYVIGSKLMSTQLGEMSEAVNDSYLKLKFNYKYDDPKDTERLFYRSDHYNYAKRGVPIIFYFDGVHEDYHRVGDEPQKIDYAKMEKVTRTVFATMWTIANMKERPKVDKQLPTTMTR